MNHRNPQRPRIKLPPEVYKELQFEVLRRDNWRCQNCGSSQNLQVHHQKFRSRRGDDCEQNLISLCAQCHSSMHGGLD
ncbi:MAG: hypothetical protein DMG82_07815 [Acidobacteria bacterium]|nr:MAG: hypothetical protein DMG82_07815 [Acidobacteriota bacterium]PYX42453.1 MAG: hypothetical protein DMG83_20765 [Acidobacteriota bacterium]